MHRTVPTTKNYWPKMSIVLRSKTSDENKTMSGPLCGDNSSSILGPANSRYIKAPLVRS